MALSQDILAEGGSPAWAGIDRTRRGFPPVWRWFPRVGGDRPIDHAAGIDRIVVPPRGRG